MRHVKHDVFYIQLGWLIHLCAVNSCKSVSCLINTEPIELSCLHPSEPIVSESGDKIVECVQCRYLIPFSGFVKFNERGIYML